MSDKCALIEPSQAAVTLRHRYELVGLNRANWYAHSRRPADESVEHLQLMDRFDELYTAHPFYGSGKLPSP